MKKAALRAAGISVLGILIIVAASCSMFEETLSPLEQNGLLSSQSKQNDNPGPDPEALPMNLSFPVIWAYPPSDSLLNPYILKTESITKVYADTDYPYAEETLIAYLQENDPWYPQPPYANENTWVADYLVSDAMHTIAFVDWGNPMENINPRVGQRFPVEVALYEKLGEVTELGLVGTTMEAFTMACLEYSATRDELFGTNNARYASCFATVLTSEFTVTVRPPDTWQEYEIRLDPAVGPSGKMNFASANGGWIPEVPGWHRITLTVNDPNISLSGAIVNNDEHYNLMTGEMLEELSHQRLDLTGIYYNTTYIDVYVTPAGGKL